MVLDLSILVIAVVLLVVGARGTYANLWNSVFPHYPISTPSAPAGSGPSVQVTPGGSTIQAPVGNTGTTQPVIIGGQVHSIPAVVAPASTPQFVCDTNGQNCVEYFH